MRTSFGFGWRAAARLGTAALLLSAATCGFAQEKTAADAAKHWPTNEDLRHLRAMGDARLAPDGARVLLRVTESTADGAAGHLWVVDVLGDGAPRQLTFSPDGEERGERGGEWMPDGHGVLFLAKRGERTGLFRLPMDGGEAVRFPFKVPVVVDESKRVGAVPPVSATDAEKAGSGKAEGEKAELDVSGFTASPDGRWIAVVASDPETAGEKKQKEAKADATAVDQDAHGERLYLLEVATGKVTAVSSVPADVRGVSWSRDGARMAVLVEGMNGVGDLAPAGSAWMVAVADVGRAAKLEGVPATVRGVTWAADGQSLLMEAGAKGDVPPGVADVYRYTLATRELRDLTVGYKGSVEGGVVALRDGVEVGLEGGGGMPRGDGGTVVQVQEGFKTGPALLRDGRVPEKVQVPLRSVSGVATNATQTGWVMVGSGRGLPPELLYQKTLGGETRVLQLPAMGWEGLRRGAGSQVTWRNEGMTIEGLLYLPPGSPDRKVPLVVDVHGGPTGAFRDQHEPLYDLMLGRGWAVLLMNPRGSTGYGAAFAAADKNDLGGADFRDLMAGVDEVLKTEPVDAGKMGLMGYSYGGEMAGFAEGRTDRFKGIVSGAPVTDQFSEYGTERGSWYDRWFYGGVPWEHPESAARQSPLAGMRNAKTPMLILQGESDVTDPLGQSQEMYRLLRQKGVPVDLVTYPREDHGPLARGMYGMPSPEPWHGFDARQRVVGFFAKVFGEDTGTPAK